MPKGGTIEVDENCNVSIAFHNDNWCAVKASGETTVSIQDYQEGECEASEEISGEIVSVATIPDIDECLGSTDENIIANFLHFAPTEVEVTLDNGLTTMVEIDWIEENKSCDFEEGFLGNLILPTGISNPSDLQAQAFSCVLC